MLLLKQAVICKHKLVDLNTVAARSWGNCPWQARFAKPDVTPILKRQRAWKVQTPASGTLLAAIKQQEVTTSPTRSWHIECGRSNCYDVAGRLFVPVTERIKELLHFSFSKPAFYSVTVYL